eukprot:scaffold276510_cov28-Tisochrysis_lutea.AAC.1
MGGTPPGNWKGHGASHPGSAHVTGSAPTPQIQQQPQPHATRTNKGWYLRPSAGGTAHTTANGEWRDTLDARTRSTREKTQSTLPLSTFSTQVLLTDNDLEPEGNEEFEISSEIIIAFTPYERGHKIKDEEAVGAIVAHLNKLEGVDLEP